MSADEREGWSVQAEHFYIMVARCRFTCCWQVDFIALQQSKVKKKQGKFALLFRSHAS
jgi:hypothetical protein